MNTPKYIHVYEKLLKDSLKDLYEEIVNEGLHAFRGDRDVERNRRYREVFLPKIGLRYIQDSMLCYEVTNPKAWLFYSMQSDIRYREENLASIIVSRYSRC